MPEISQLLSPTVEDIAQILNLFRLIPGRTCSAKNYMEHLNQNWENIALFIAREKDGTICGFTHAEKPSLLEPKIGWLPFSYLGPKADHKIAEDALRLALVWLKDCGASSVRMTSIRPPKVLKKVYGFELAKEKLFEKEIP